jgi:trk system potassium uptake protein TrkH
MFFGGSAGSTAGGIKMIRILILFKVAIRQIRVMLQPRLISPVKIAGRVLDEARVRDIVSFFLLFMILAALFSVIMSTMVPDLETAVSSVISALGNIGPGIAGVGAYENYSWIPIPGKWILILCMLLGRLEIYTVLIAFSPVSWKK